MDLKLVGQHRDGAGTVSAILGNLHESDQDHALHTNYARIHHVARKIYAASGRQHVVSNSVQHFPD
uniref:Uncharacterized protein n=1 Tax=mine drainage metagenome TaxID=410659 RepID=E6QPU5_9ZZZZ